jgi:hypothetical protein
MKFRLAFGPFQAARALASRGRYQELREALVRMELRSLLCPQAPIAYWPYSVKWMMHARPVRLLRGLR